MRNLTSLVQEVLKANVNMASRLKNLERMHPALAASLCTSQTDNAKSEGTNSRAVSRRTYYRFTFEEELETSPVYKRAGLNHIRFSKSSTSTYGPSCLSGLSLSDVGNVSTITLPISPMELWNHHRYRLDNAGSATTATSLDAWYNPPAKVRLPDLPTSKPQTQVLTSATEKRLHTNRLLQRPIHKPVRAVEVHRPPHIPALHNHNPSLPARLHRRRHHAPEPQRARADRRRGLRERRALRTRRHGHRTRTADRE